MNIAYLKATYGRLTAQRDNLKKVADGVAEEVKNLEDILHELDKALTEHSVRAAIEAQAQQQ